MLDYQKRMLDEYKVLKDNVKKLDEFINSSRFTDLEVHKQKLMLWQRSSMISYSQALGERIKCEGFNPCTGEALRIHRGWHPDV